MNGLAMASSDMFLAMICFCVMNCEAVIARIMMIERIQTATWLPSPPCRSEADSVAPKIVDSSNWVTCWWLMAPMPSPLSRAVLMPERTVKSAKKNGIWISMGRQAENGLVPCFLYMAICSCDMAWRDSWSVLPLYLSWSFFRSGCSSCMPRWALICLTNTGIRAARMTSTRPMMDRVHVQPEASGMPMALRPSWKPTMMMDTSHLNGNISVSKKSIRYPYSSGRSAAFSISLSSQVLIRVVQHNNCGGLVFRPVPVAGGDMVHTTGIPRVAARKALRCEPASLYGTVHGDGLKRVGGARRKKTADLTIQGRNHLAIGHQQKNEDVARQVPEECASGRCCGLCGTDDGGNQVKHAVSLPVLFRSNRFQPSVAGGFAAASWWRPTQRCSPPAVPASWQ